jgi:uncharacterized protein (DUF1501 family)
MDRRKFLGNTALFAVPLMLKGIPVFAGDGALNPLLQSLTLSAANCGKVLVIIQLNGGNDGLNMVIPVDKYAQLATARPAVLIPENQTLSLNGSTTTKLHPSMVKLKNLYNEGKVNFVQGVSYPNPNYSHFQAQDIWFTGSGSGTTTGSTGWLGRELDMAYPGFPAGYPNAANPDPIAIQIGGTLPLSLQGQNINMAYNAPNPTYLINVATANPAPAPVSDYGTELTFLRLMKEQSNAYTTRISNAYASQQTLSTLYPYSPTYNYDDYLAEQLKVVARLIGGGLQTSVYVVNHGYGFDSHVDQVASTTTTGEHARNLKILSDAIAAFQDDITLMGKANKVVGMTFSEFGRRVISNDSKGTDHGSGAPVIFFGAGVNGGITGTSPVLPSVIDGNTQVPLQYDYRQLYATIMQQLFCMTAAQTQTILNGIYAPLPLFNATVVPLEGIELKASWEGALAKITFDVFENETYEKFEIEKSTDTNNRFVSNKILQGTNNATLSTYTFSEDRIRANDVFYRIKGITKTGKIVYSNIVRLNNKQVQEISVFPNPVTNFTINIEFAKTVNENVSFTIFGTKGERLFYNQINPRGNKLIKIKVPDYFNVHTLYLLNITYGDTIVNEKLIFE